MESVWTIEGVVVSEPMTLITNVLLFVCGLYCGIRVIRGDNGDLAFVRHYGMFLVYTGISALFGGIFSHGFKTYFPPSYSIPGWILALGGAYHAACGGILHAHAQAISIVSTSRRFMIASRINLGILILTGMYLLFRPHFLIVTLYSAFCISVTAAISELLIYRKTKAAGSRFYLMAVGLGIVTLLIFVFKIGWGPGFTANDAAHIVMIISFFVFMKAFKAMR